MIKKSLAFVFLLVLIGFLKVRSYEKNYVSLDESCKSLPYMKVVDDGVEIRNFKQLSQIKWDCFFKRKYDYDEPINFYIYFSQDYILNETIEMSRYRSSSLTRFVFFNLKGILTFNSGIIAQFIGTGLAYQFFNSRLDLYDESRELIGADKCLPTISKTKIWAILAVGQQSIFSSI